MNLQVRRSCVTVIRMNTNPNDTTKPDLKVIEGGDQMERESAEALLVFLQDPFSAEAEAALRTLEARRAPRGSLRAV